jgi:hypothetical protein
MNIHLIPAWMLCCPSRLGLAAPNSPFVIAQDVVETPSPAASPVRCHQRLWTSAAHPACISLPRASHSFTNMIPLPNDSCRIAWATSETHGSRVYGCSTEQYPLAMAPNSEIPFTAANRQWLLFISLDCAPLPSGSKCPRWSARLWSSLPT